MRQLQQIERMGKTIHLNSKPGESIVTAAEVALGSTVGQWMVDAIRYDHKIRTYML